MSSMAAPPLFFVPSPPSDMSMDALRRQPFVKKHAALSEIVQGPQHVPVVIAPPRENCSRTPRAYHVEELQSSDGADQITRSCKSSENLKSAGSTRSELSRTAQSGHTFQRVKQSLQFYENASDRSDTSITSLMNSYENESESETDLEDLLEFTRASHAELQALTRDLLVEPHDFEVDYIDSARCILGEGGQAKIFAAFCKDRKVAVKVSSHSAILREFSIAQQLRPHPHIVRVVGYTIVKPENFRLREYLGTYDNGGSAVGGELPAQRSYSTHSIDSNASAEGEENRADWVYMAGYEFCGNGDLGSYLRANPSESGNITFMSGVFDGILSALEHLHQNGFIHSDIKPDNVLVTDDLKVRLSDFGLCQRCDEEMSPQGTPSYLAPEIVDAWFASSEHHEFTTKVDIFSFGVLMVHTLTNKYPFSRITRLLKRGRALSESDLITIYTPAPDVISAIESIDSRFAVMVKLCLRRKPTERPSATDLRRILNIRLSGEKRLSPSPFGFGSTSPTPVRRDI